MVVARLLQSAEAEDELETSKEVHVSHGAYPILF